MVERQSHNAARTLSARVRPMPATGVQRSVLHLMVTGALSLFALVSLVACSGSATDSSTQPNALQAADVASPLAGTRWVLTELDATPVAQLNIDSVAPTIEFDTTEPFTIRAFAGCNDIGGDVVVEGLNLSIQNLHASRKYCESVMALETQFSHMLQDLRAHAMRNDALVLFDDKGMVRARFRAAR